MCFNISGNITKICFETSLYCAYILDFRLLLYIQICPFCRLQTKEPKPSYLKEEFIKFKTLEIKFNKSAFSSLLISTIPHLENYNKITKQHPVSVFSQPNSSLEVINYQEIVKEKKHFSQCMSIFGAIKEQGGTQCIKNVKHMQQFCFRTRSNGAFQLLTARYSVTPLAGFVC